MRNSTLDAYRGLAKVFIKYGWLAYLSTLTKSRKDKGFNKLTKGVIR